MLNRIAFGWGLRRDGGLQGPSDNPTLYLIKDVFTTARAAGAVNGTLAEPGGVGTTAQITRTATDGNSKLTIASNLLTFATGGVGSGNPSLWYGSFTRVNGRTVMARLNFSAGTGLALSWDSNQAGAPDDFLRLSTSGPGLFSNNGVSVGAASTSTNYDMAIVMGTAYTYMYIKGGAFSVWTLVYIVSSTTSPMFPSLNSQQGTTTVGTFSNARVPNDAITAPMGLLAYDNFGRANGALGSTQTTGPDSQTVVAKSWTNPTGTIAVSSNAAACSATSGGIAVAHITFTTIDVSIDVKVTRTAGNGGIILRYADTNNYIIAYHDGTNAKVDKVVAGSTTNIISGAATYGAGRILKVYMSGTSIQLYYGAVGGISKIGSTSTISDAGLQTSAVCGLYGTDTSCIWDDFLVAPVGSSSEYSIFNNY